MPMSKKEMAWQLSNYSKELDVMWRQLSIAKNFIQKIKGSTKASDNLSVEAGDVLKDMQDITE